MELIVRDGSWLSKLDISIVRNLPVINRRPLIYVRLDLWKGRFVKTYANSIVIEEGALYPWDQIMEIFEHARQPSQLQQFAHECEQDELRREGYYHAMDHLSTANTD